jgi:hypothetical protein
MAPRRPYVLSSLSRLSVQPRAFLKKKKIPLPVPLFVKYITSIYISHPQGENAISRCCGRELKWITSRGTSSQRRLP